MKTQNNQNGFSLIEVVLMIVILGIAVPPLINLMKTNLKGTGDLSQVSNATFIARQQMEQIISDYTSHGFSKTFRTGQYPSQTSNGITTTVIFDTTATWNGSRYATVTVTASVPNLSTNSISLMAYLPRDYFP